ncbi:MAG: SelB C-terminal domain-containing protein, partial [bacterium]
LAILQLLGIPHLFIAITKVFGADHDWLDLIEEEITSQLPESLRSAVRFFRCDSVVGQGIEELKAALFELSETLPPRQDSGVFRLPVDRAFVIKGYGTVITGTVLSGSIHIGDQLQVMPAGFSVRVRGLQRHGHNVPMLGIGERTAVNLVVQESAPIRRGDWLCEKNACLSSDLLTVHVQNLPDSPLLKNRDRIRLHLGTAEIIGRMLIHGQDEIPAGGSGFAQLVLEEPATAVRGDCFILRRYSPLLTLGGGVVLDPIPAEKRRLNDTGMADLEKLRQSSDIEALFIKVKQAGKMGLSWLEARAFLFLPELHLTAVVKQLEKLGQIRQLRFLDGARLVSNSVISSAQQSILQKVRTFHRNKPELLGIRRASLISDLSAEFPAPLLEELLTVMVSESRELIFDRGYVRCVEHTIQLDSELETISAQIEERLQQSGFAPLTMESLIKETRLSETALNQVLVIMVQQGRIVRQMDGSIWTSANLRSAWESIKPRLSKENGRSTSELRDVLSCPRRHTVAILEYFDSLGLTERREDLRFPGRCYDDPMVFG